MKIIDKYVFKELLSPFLLGLFVFTFVLLSNALVRMLDLLITKGVKFSTILKLLILSLPHLLVLTIPMSALLAVLLCFGRLSSDSEITAFKASGIPLHRIFIPVFIFSFINFLLTLYIFLTILPKGNLALKQLRFDIIRTRANIRIKPQIFNTDFYNLVIYANRVPPKSTKLYGVFISNNLNDDENEIIIAKEAEKILLPQQKKIILQLRDGCSHSIPKNNPKKYSINPFSIYNITLDMEIFKSQKVGKGDREMTIKELRAKALRRKKQGRNYYPQLVEIHKKL